MIKAIVGKMKIQEKYVDLKYFIQIIREIKLNHKNCAMKTTL